MDHQVYDFQRESLRPVPQQRIIAKLDEYMSRRDYAGAERHLKYWLTEAELAGDLRGQLMLRNELVGHFRKTGDKGQAFWNAEKALALIKELEFDGTISSGTTYTNVATAYNAFGENERSLEIFKKAAAVYESISSTPATLLGGLYNNMALTCVSLGRFEEADALYKKALKQMEEVEGGALEQAITYLNMADAVQAGTEASEAGTDEYDAAEKKIEEYLDKAQALLDDPSLTRDGYYAFVCEKCAPVFEYYGYFLAAGDLKERAEAIYGRK